MIRTCDRAIRFLLILYSFLYVLDFFCRPPYIREVADCALAVFLIIAFFTMPKLNLKVCLGLFIVGLITFIIAGAPIEKIFTAISRNAGLVVLYVYVPVLSMPFFYDDYQNQIGNIAKKYMTSVLPFLVFCLLSSYFLSLVMAMGCVLVLYDLFSQNAREYNIQMPFRAAIVQGYAAGGLCGPAWATMSITSARLDISLVELIPAGTVFSLSSLIVSTLLLRRIITKNPQLYPPLTPDPTVAVNWKKVRTLFMLAAYLIIAVISINYATGWSMFIIGPLLSFPFAITAALLVNKTAQFKSAVKNYYNNRIYRPKGEMGLFIVGGFLGTAFEYSEIGLLAIQLLPDTLLGYPMLISCMLSLIIVCFALFGIHPVVVAPTLAVAIPPAHLGLNTLTFALALISGWVLGVSISPFSSANMIIAGFEQKSPWEAGPYTNWRYCLCMIAVFGLAVGALARLTA